MKKVTQITYGLFPYRGRYFFTNIKEIPKLVKRICFVIKHGYTDLMWWSTRDWFVSGMKDALINYRHNRNSTPVVIPDYSTENAEKNEYVWNNILNRMIEYISYMDETNPIYDDIDPKVKYEMMEYYKDKFFELYSKYFYNLWD